MREWNTRYDEGRGREGYFPVIKPPSLIGITNETDRLRKVVVWGEPSIEAELAQHYPLHRSLFQQEMDVLKAREEMRSFVDVLEGLGVEIFQVRDWLHPLLPRPLAGRDQILAKLFRKSSETQKHYGIHKPRYKDVIEDLLDQDIERYGERGALALAKALCLDPIMPMGNMIFARDQMNVLFDRRIQASMAKPIRRAEIGLYERFYRDVLGLENPITLPRGETYEGGDSYFHNGVPYTGVGARTTRGAAIHIVRSLGDQGVPHVLVEDRDVRSRPFEDQQDFMHLDMLSNSVGKNTAFVCEEEAARRKVSVAWFSRNGEFHIEDTQDSFLDHLVKWGNKILAVPSQEQKAFGCNFLMIDDHTAILPTDCNSYTNNLLQGAGVELIFVDLGEITKGYGAAHCITGQLLRTPKKI